MADANKLKNHILRLQETHSLLNKEVDKMMKEVGFADTGRVGALKQKKLYIKDQIMKLQKEVDLLGDPVYTK
jgi:hypothetical protein|tara:strand:- start:277 stop:492 length:216 start_codon:yes stop_codon:yes gene_type:complete